MVQCGEKHHPIEMPRGAEIQSNLGGNCIWTPIWNGKKTPGLMFSFKGHFQWSQKHISRRRPTKGGLYINQLRWKFFIWDEKFGSPVWNPEMTGWILSLLVVVRLELKGGMKNAILGSHESDIFENGNVFCLQVVYLYNMTFGMGPWVVFSRSCFAHGEWVWWH